MQTTHRKRWAAVGAAFGAGVAAIVVASLSAFAGSGVAAGTASPVNTTPPSISGTAEEGKTLTASDGAWTGATSFKYIWTRCNKSGNSCHNISGATSKTYKLTSADVGNTLRFRVRATNNDGTTEATSETTAVIQKASTASPMNTSPPTVSGTPQEGKQLQGNRGNWDNNPNSYAYAWLRCNNTGGSCAAISGANTQNYTLKSADVGNTLRFRVQATNNDGTTTATSVPTAVIQKASTPTPPPSNGCPPSGSNQVSQMSLPAKLIIDQFQSDPPTLNGGTNSFTLRVHVTSTCGGPVSGALVYGTPTPFNQFDETQTNTASDGWATLNFSRQANYPVNGKQQILAMFLRASKPGENILAGITGYRLVNVNVNL